MKITTKKKLNRDTNRDFQVCQNPEQMKRGGGHVLKQSPKDNTNENEIHKEIGVKTDITSSNSDNQFHMGCD